MNLVISLTSQGVACVCGTKTMQVGLVVGLVQIPRPAVSVFVSLIERPPSLFDLNILKSTWLPISWALPASIAVQATGYCLLQSCLRQSFA